MKNSPLGTLWRSLPFRVVLFFPLILFQHSQPVTFQYVEVDPLVAGDCKAVGDMDGDGYPDLVVGGMPGEKLNWYRNPDWRRTMIATPSNEFTTDCSLADMDGDGDLDIVVPDGNSGDNLHWFQNPRPSGDPAYGGSWTRHTIGSIGDWGKDVKIADFDKDGWPDVATRGQGDAMIFFQTGSNSWTKVVLNVSNLGSEGLGLGDVDGDNHPDLVVQGGWLKNPGGAAARTAGNWLEYPIGQVDSSFKAVVADINGDGKKDVVFSSSEGTDDVAWWSYGSAGPTGPWSKHLIVQGLDRTHTLQVADMDGDGYLDVVTAQMHTSVEREVAVWFNQDRKGTSWRKQVVATTGLHNGQVADINRDNRPDIFGANWTGNPPVKLWLNRP
jgi:hypothetical protein